MNWEELTPEQEEAMDRAMEAVRKGRVDDAYGELETLPADHVSRCDFEFRLQIEDGDLAAARRCYEVLKEYRDYEDALMHVELLTAEWRFDEARVLIVEHAADIPFDQQLLGRCHELAGDFEASDRCYSRWCELGGRDTLPLLRVPPEEFDEIIAKAIRELPEQHREALESVEVIVEPVPSIEHVRGSDLGQTPPSMLGLFDGASMLERDPEAPEPPPRIFLFQRNIELAAHDMRDLAEQVEITLLHELGHLLGFDEEGVAELGLE